MLGELVQVNRVELCFFPYQLVKVILHDYLFGQTSLLGTLKAFVICYIE